MIWLITGMIRVCVHGGFKMFKTSVGILTIISAKIIRNGKDREHAERHLQESGILRNVHQGFARPGSSGAAGTAQPYSVTVA